MLKLNEAELDNIIEAFKPFYGLKLTEVLYHKYDLVLGFYDGHVYRWIWIDMNSKTLGVFPLDVLKKKIKSEKKPLNLFIKSNFIGKTLLSVERLKNYGRVVDFYFEDDCVIQIRLFSSGKNIEARALGKKVYLNKPNELTEAVFSGLYESRSWTEILSRWENLRINSYLKQAEVDEKRHQKEIAKKEKALEKTKTALLLINRSVWKKVGDYISENQNLDIDHEWLEFVNKKESLSWNIQNCFKKHKQSLHKKQGMQERIEILEKEISALQAGNAKKKTTPRRKLLEQSSAKGRRWALADGMTLTVGKSAQDNLKLLRKVRPWHLWLHISGRPSAHGFIECQRKQEVSLSIILKAAEIFVKENFGDKASKHQGEKFDVIYAQCRYIRPIKGDRHGRVIYQNEKMLTVKIPESL